MKLHISVSVHCPHSSIERKVHCYLLPLDKYCCQGCDDVSNSDICKNCINEVIEKLSLEDFSANIPYIE